MNDRSAMLRGDVLPLLVVVLRVRGATRVSQEKPWCDAPGSWRYLRLSASLSAVPRVRQAWRPRRNARLIVDDRARWACYDEVFGKPVGAGAQPAPVAASASAGAAGEQAAVSRNPRTEFGLSEAAMRARAAETGRETASRTAYRQRLRRSVDDRPRKWSSRSSDGQVWVQLEPDTRAKVKAGDTVTIKRAALGSYLLVTPGGIATRVKRLK